jgi:hypothetical protein
VCRAQPEDDDRRTDAVQFTTIGDRLYLARRDNGAEPLAAYDLGDLHQLWRSTSAPIGRLTWCGPYLCLTTAFGATVLNSGNRSGSLV